MAVGGEKAGAGGAPGGMYGGNGKGGRAPGIIGKGGAPGGIAPGGGRGKPGGIGGNPGGITPGGGMLECM